MTLRYWHHHGDSNENIANSKSELTYTKPTQKAPPWFGYLSSLPLASQSHKHHKEPMYLHLLHIILIQKFITISMFIQCVHLFYRMPIESCGIWSNKIFRDTKEGKYTVLFNTADN